MLARDSAEAAVDEDAVELLRSEVGAGDSGSETVVGLS